MLRSKLASNLTNTAFGGLSDRFWNLISNFEGFTAVAQWDYAQWSIGYGSGYNWDLKRPVQKGDVVDKATAKRWLLLEAEKHYNAVKSMVKVPINDNQLIALASFAYNVGDGALQSSNLLKLLNSGADKNIVANEFDKWRMAGGKVLTALVNRRAAEKKLFLS